MNISIVIAQEEHFKYAKIICDTIESSALLRGTGCKRTPDYILKKIENKDAVIALDNGVLLVLLYRKLARQQLRRTFRIDCPDYRNLGLAKKIKSKV
jgi:hypothetical protein